MVILEFEKSIFELEAKIRELKSLDSSDIKITDEIRKLETKLVKISDEVYLGKECNVYESNGVIKAIEEGDFSYYVWSGEAFKEVMVHREFHPANIIFSDVEEPFVPKYAEELSYGSERLRTWKQIVVSTAEGFVEIPDECDVEQIYADGEMVADKFYDGEAWRVPAKLLYGKKCYLVMSELKDDIYREW